MSTDNRKIQIGVEVDASGAKAGLDQVADSASNMANQVSGSGEKAKKSLSGMGEGAKASADTLSRAERSMVQSIERATAAFSAGSKSSSDYYRVLATQRGIDPKILEPYLTALDKVAPKQKAASDAIMATVPAMQKYEMSAKATAAALRQVPAQVTDIVVGLQGGQAPLTVLLQQGGQLKDIFGGVGAAARAVGGYIVGLINPTSVVLGTIGLFGYAFTKGQQEAEAFNKALILTGNYAGTSAGALQKMAVAVADATGSTKGAAAEALTKFAASGEVAAVGLERFAAAAIKLQRETGTAIDETVKQFVALGKDPVAASVKLNETTRYLTLSIYNQIKALDDQGKSAQAAALAQNAYADSLTQRTDKLQGNLGYLERAWRAVAGTAKAAWDAMLNVGRTEDTESRIDAVRKKLAEYAEAEKLRKQAGGFTFDVNGPEIKQLTAELAKLEEIAKYKDRAARIAAQEASDVQTRIEFDKDRALVLDKDLRMKKELAAAEEKYQNALKRGVITQKEYGELIAGIRKKFTDTGAINKDAELDKSTAAFDILKIQKGYEARAGAIANGEKILDALRSAGVLDDAAYFGAKRAALEEVARLEEQALNEEIKREKERKIIGATETDRALARLDRDKKVYELEQKRDKAKADSLTASVLLGVQETTTGEKITKAYQEARAAAQEYFDTAVRGYSRTLSAQGRGTAANAKIAGETQITDKYAADRNAAQRKFQAGPDNAQTREELNKQLALIEEFQTKALTAWDEYYKNLKESETNWVNGANRAIENYLDASINISAQSERVFTNAFSNMEDALVSFVTTGKLSFTSFANSLVADITRIIVKQQILAPLSQSLGGSGGLGGIFNSIFGTVLGSGAPPSAVGFGPRALGGPVSAGGLYEVNERGPEMLNVAGRQFLMMGSKSGSVTPNSAIGGNTVNVTVNQSFASGTTRATTLQAAADARRQLEFAGRNL